MQNNERQVSIQSYVKFVDTLTSEPSKNFQAYRTRLEQLKSKGCDISRLDTAISGLMSESGEAMEILKKVKFQGKEWNEDVKYHLVREAGDIIFYWINLCIALELNPDDIILENVKKLEARYPGGNFDVYFSENRKEGDL
jgi:NTP pyrophosphatase (non-canonical NTP hydrolase)